MNRQKRKSVLLNRVVLSVVVLMFSCFGLSAEVPPVKAVNAAQSGLSHFLSQSSFPGGSPFGNTPKAQLEAARVDLGFQVHTILPQRLVMDRESTLDRMVTPTGVWRFVVKSGDKPLALLTVAKVNGNWQTVSIGGAGLATEIDKITGIYPKSGNFEFRFVRVFQAKADLMEIRQGKNIIGFAPMKSAQVALKLQDSTTESSPLMYESEITEPLRHVVSDVMAKENQLKSTIETEK